MYPAATLEIAGSRPAQLEGPSMVSCARGQQRAGQGASRKVGFLFFCLSLCKPVPADGSQSGGAADSFRPGQARAQQPPLAKAWSTSISTRQQNACGTAARAAPRETSDTVQNRSSGGGAYAGRRRQRQSTGIVAMKMRRAESARTPILPSAGNITRPIITDIAGTWLPKADFLFSGST